MSDMTIFNPNEQANLPAHLQGLGLGVGSALMAAIGDSYNRIGVKGSRFRQVINGQEVGVWDENYLDVIIVGVVPSNSRIYYAGKYKQQGDNAPPTCFSVDNIAPPEDLPTRQSDKCATCQWNVVGSRIGDDGHSGKACGYFRRIAIILPGDDTLYRVDVKAQGLFGKSYDKLNKFSMNDYAKFLQTRSVDASLLVTRLSFDTDVSVPKLLFQPARYITEEEVAMVQELARGDDIAKYLEINFKTIDISGEDATGNVEEDVPEAEAAQATQATSQTLRKPTPAAVVQAPQKPAVAPAAKPQAAKPVAAKPQAPKPVAKPQTPTPVAAVQVDSGIAAPVSTPVEIGTDAGLKSLIEELGL